MKITKKQFLVLASAFVVIMFAGLTYLYSHRVAENKQNPNYEKINCEISQYGIQMYSASSYFNITGIVTNKPFGRLRVRIDNIDKGSFFYNGGTFNYTAKIKDLTPGWHYINFTPIIKKGHRELGARQGIFINKPENSKTVIIVPESYVRLARQGNTSKKTKLSVTMPMDDSVKYSASGRYWDGKVRALGPIRKYDKDGILMIKNSKGEWKYQPTAICQRALHYYDPSWKNDENAKSSDGYKTFIKYSDWLIENMGKDGAFRFTYEQKYLTTDLKPGWVSGMTQGQVLSVLGRAYYLTGDEKYDKAGRKVLTFMLKENTETDTAKQNGTADTLQEFTKHNYHLSKYKDYKLYEEMVVTPQVYILNGDLYALNGLYDWSQLSGDKASAKDASKAFKSGITAIETLLPYYDFYGYSSYDLRQYTAGITPRFESGYAHNCHVTILRAMSDVTGSKVLYHYYKQFRMYTEDPFFRQTATIYKDTNNTSDSSN